MSKKSRSHIKKKKFLVVFIGLIIFFVAVFYVIIYFDMVRSYLRKTNFNIENYQDVNGNLLNSEVNLIGENKTIPPNFQLQYQKERSVYITCQNGKINVKYQDQVKEMTSDDYIDLWRTLIEKDIWNLPTGELGPLAIGAGTQTVATSLNDSTGNQKNTSFEVMNPGLKNIKQFSIIYKIKDLVSRYFPS